MKRFLQSIAIGGALLSLACQDDPNLDFGNRGGDPNHVGEPNEIGDQHDPNGAGDPNDADHGDDDPNSTNDDPNSIDEPNSIDNGDAVRTITGLIQPPASKRRPRSVDADVSYQVVVQSADSMEVYTGRTDGEGVFNVDIPEGETGELFIVTLISPEGQALGPVMFGESDDGGMGMVGLELFGDGSLGTIDAPEAPGDAPIMPGDDKNLVSATIAEDVEVRLNDDGVPVGVGDVGKGDNAITAGVSDNPRQQCDRDMDGLIDIFDADDNGNGTVDNFDPDQSAALLNELHGINMNIFMNLKIGEADAASYFNNDTAAIEESLKTDTVITFEARFDGRGGRTLTGVRVLSAPAPTYLPGTTLLGGSTLWSDSGYELSADGANHFQAFVTPNAFIDAGDVFTIEYTFDDGSTRIFTEMLNYVFRNIPQLVNAGSPGALTPAPGAGTTMFDGTQDLVLEWMPPEDETGAAIVSVGYRFELFFHDLNGMQIDGIDGATTWPTAISGWNATNRAYEVSGDSLTTPSADGTFTVQLPSGIFVDTVQTSSGPISVGTYVIDIAAQDDGNNAALKVRFDKQ